jgi:hypothetical protein
MVAASGWKNELTEAIFTIDPEPRSSIGPSAARVARNPVKKSILSAHSNSSSLVAKKPSTLIRTAPTLLTSTRLGRARRSPSARACRPVISQEVDRNRGDTVEPVEVLRGE